MANSRETRLLLDHLLVEDVCPDGPVPWNYRPQMKAKNFLKTTLCQAGLPEFGVRGKRGVACPSASGCRGPLQSYVQTISGQAPEALSRVGKVLRAGVPHRYVEGTAKRKEPGLGCWGAPEAGTWQTANLASPPHETGARCWRGC